MSWGDHPDNEPLFTEQRILAIFLGITVMLMIALAFYAHEVSIKNEKQTFTEI